MIDMVQCARRVIGYGGAFPPYGPLVRKVGAAKSIEDAFLLRPSLREIKKKLDICNTDAEMVYAFYKKNDLTVRDVPLEIVLKRVGGFKTEICIPLMQDKQKQKRLNDTSDWR